MSSPPPPTDALALALRDLQTGHPEQAENRLKGFLKDYPAHPGGLHLLGLVALKTGRPEQGIAAISKAVSAEPGNPTLLLNLGECCRKAGRLDEAVRWYRKAIALRPDYHQAHYNLGLALAAGGELEGAEQSYRKALDIKPDYVLALTNLGNLLKRQNRAAQALEYHQRALASGPPHPDRLFNLGNTLAALGRQAEAEQVFRRALALRPDHAGALNNLGISLREQGKLPDALACHRRAVQLNPGDPESLCNLGVALKDAGDKRTSLECLQRASRAAPGDVGILCNLAHALTDEERVQEAESVWRRALELAPDSPQVREGIGGFFWKQGDVEQARPHLEIRLAAEPDNLLPRLRAEGLCPVLFPDVRAMEDFRASLADRLKNLRQRSWRIDIDEIPSAGCEPSFNLPFHGRDDLPLKRSHAALFAGALPTGPDLPPRRGKPHVGIIVTSGHEGVFVNSVLANIARFSPGAMRLNVVCAPGSLPALRRHVDHPDVTFMPMASRFSQLLEDLRRARFDLLYYHEVGSDAVNYCLPHFRLAPVQCTTWGIQVTTGIPNMDVYLSSKWTEPEDASGHYSERLILLDTLLKQRKPFQAVAQRRRADFGLPETGTLYFCPQHLGKFHPEFDPVVREILSRDERGVLVLVEWPSAFVGRQLMARFARTLPDVVDRVRLLPHLNPEDYRGLLQLADVMLDPFHFVGVNTTYDALSLHKPVVTLPGRFQRGRYTLGCYRKMGIPDCVADTPRDYAEIALRLAGEPDYRRAVEQRIAEAAPELFDGRAIAAELQACFLRLVERSRSA